MFDLLDLSLILLGFIVGTFGSLVGVGGGIILVPVFFFLYPERPTSEITALSLAVIFFNSLSGSLAYALKGKIDYRSGLAFTLAAAPGAVFGASLTGYLSRDIFDPLFAVFLIVVGVYLFFKPEKKSNTLNSESQSRYPIRILTEKNGTQHKISYSLPLGLGVSSVVGFISSLFGIGGGIIHVPAMIYLLRFPIHIATSTSQFILALSAMMGVMTHFTHGTLQSSTTEIIFLTIGVIPGAQLGAKLSALVKGRTLIKVLAVAMVLVALRLLLLN
jgi:uncharacterized membrane protein YfcA